MEAKKEVKVLEKVVDLDAIAEATEQKGVFVNNQTFEFGWRAGKALSNSKFVPDTFKGSPEDCMIALDMAQNLNVNPVLLMQHLYIIHGRPAMDAQMQIALFNRQRKWSAIQYKESGKGDDYQMLAYTKDLTTGEFHEGPPISWKLVKAEGWEKKNGSKWKTIPELMFRYRSGSWLIRTLCPEAVLGLMTVDEVRDMEPTGTTPQVQPEPEHKIEPPDEPAPDRQNSDAFNEILELATEDTELMDRLQDELAMPDGPKTELDAERLAKAFKVERKKNAK
jgi:hypothetical protein